MTVRHDPGTMLPPAEVAGGSPGPRRLAGSVSSAVGSHLRDPMRRSSYALIIGTGLTSALGLVFWALAARWLPAATVGIGASLVTVMTLLANLSTLGLRNGLVRFLPSAGGTSRRLIASAYAVCAGAAALVALVFLSGRGWWASKLDLLAHPLAAAAFVLATMIWVLFVLQDHVLVGLRSTGWVPLANGLCSVAKIALLPLTAVLAGWAILAATVVPAALAVLGVSIIVWRISGRRTDLPDSEPVTVPRLVRFAVTDHLTSLLWMSATNIMMLLVLQLAGAESSAYFYLATTIGYTLYLIISNVGSALVAESARFPERAVTLARQALLNAARLVVPLALIGCLLAPVLLSLLGPAYAAHATTLLQLILLSALPQLIIGIALSTARVRNDLRTIVIVYGSIAVGDLGGTWVGLHLAGLTGVGVALLITETVVAIGLVAGGRTGLWGDRSQSGGRRLGLRSQLRAVMPPARSRRRSAALLQRGLTVCGRSAVDADPQRLPTECDTVVLSYTDTTGPAVAKIAVSAAASAGLERHAAALDEFSRLPGSPLTPLLPRVIGRGRLDGELVLLETRLPGRAAADPPGADLTAAAVRALSALHNQTTRRRTVNEELLVAWVDDPIEVLQAVPALRWHQPAMRRLRAALRAALTGADVVVTATHGDFWPGNVLVAQPSSVADTPADPSSAPMITGIVDWENARRTGLPDTDLLHWWLSGQPGEIGTTVCAVLDRAHPAAARRQPTPPPASPNGPLGLETLVLLTWLGHVADGLRRATRHPVGPVWLARNVKPVLSRFAADRRR